MRVYEGIQSALSPEGPHAAVIAEISWVLIAGATLIFGIVIAIAAYAIFARRENAMRLSEVPLIVGGGIVFPLVVLSALLIYTVVRASSLENASGETPLRIEVTGEQWWWRVRYLDEGGQLDFETANEIHIPVARAVEITLKSADVIHSFWVPALAGKLDMIPGRTHRLRIRADRTGEYRGQCAEYCGGPHAFMAFFVVAETAERYTEWAANERAAAAPRSDHAVQGEKLFVSHCAACHTIRGTQAQGVRGPDLTHLGSRLTIAAGMLPNNAGTLAGWIASSQHLKPGNLMPSFQQFKGEELRVLAHYLEGLK
ncbi:MAG: coxB [Burkholderiales bacterium]|jgi:cytochrome c oxidase subunit 2|nr:coxB [Burkholderiales bacterium]